MPASDPAHCTIGTELVDNKTHTLWRLQHDGWKAISRESRWPERDVTTDVTAAPPTMLSNTVVACIEWYEKRSAARNHEAADCWDDSSMRSLVEGMRYASVESTVPRVIDAVRATVAAWDKATEAHWTEDPAREWRLAVHELSWALVLFYDVPSEILCRVAATDIHGSCVLSFDGDCFNPPPWSAYIGGWPFVTFAGGGDTLEQAARRALRKKDAYLVERRVAAPADTPPEGVGEVSFGAEDSPT